jgi:hypothetical protein
MNGFLAPLPVFAASQCGQFGRNFSIGSLFTCLGEIFPSGPFLPVWAKFFHWVLFTSLGDIFPQGPFYQFGRYFSTGSFLLVWAEFLALRWNVEPRITDHRHADNTDVHTYMLQLHMYINVTYVHKCYICTYMLLKIFFCAIFFTNKAYAKINVRYVALILGRFYNIFGERAFCQKLESPILS